MYALIIRIGFGGYLYYNYHKEPPKPILIIKGPFIWFLALGYGFRLGASGLACSSGYRESRVTHVLGSLDVGKLLKRSDYGYRASLKRVYTQLAWFFLPRHL